MLLRYNAMQVDVFALLVDARARIQSTIAAIEANRDFRVAEAALAAAIVGGTTMSPAETSGTVASLASDSGH
jgi:outer membrane protein TolC